MKVFCQTVSSFTLKIAPSFLKINKRSLRTLSYFAIGCGMKLFVPTLFFFISKNLHHFFAHKNYNTIDPPKKIPKVVADTYIYIYIGRAYLYVKGREYIHPQVNIGCY